MKTSLLLLAPCAVLAACGRVEAPGTGAAATAAVAMLEGRSGSNVAGQLEFAAMDGGVLITGEISGLTQGSDHGFHVHEKGDCSAADAESAGDHFNPEHAPHGPPTAALSGRHVGDAPNIKADETGRSVITAAIQGATLRDGGPHDLVGKAVIVHEKRDDYVSQPAGDAGGRIACGVIR